MTNETLKTIETRRSCRAYKPEQITEEELETEEGKALLKKWGIEGDYIGVGHCILGYPAEAPKPAAPRKADYIVRV